ILRREALGQVEVPGEPSATVEGELVDAGDRVGAGEDAADGDEDDIDQGVLAGALDAGVLEVLEVLVEGGRSDVGHELLLGEDDRVRGGITSLYCTKGSHPSLQGVSILMRQPWTGMGIGGSDNVVANNVITGSSEGGLAVGGSGNIIR